MTRTLVGALAGAGAGGLIGAGQLSTAARHLGHGYASPWSEAGAVTVALHAGQTKLAFTNSPRAGRSEGAWTECEVEHAREGAPSELLARTGDLGSTGLTVATGARASVPSILPITAAAQGTPLGARRRSKEAV